VDGRTKWLREWLQQPRGGGREVFVYLDLKVPKNGGTKYKPLTTEVLIDAGWLPDLSNDLARKIETARVARPLQHTPRPGEPTWTANSAQPPGAPAWWEIVAPKDAEIDAFLEKSPELDKYIKEFLATLDPNDARKYSAYIKRRFCMYNNAFTWDELVKLSEIRDSVETDELFRWTEGRDCLSGRVLFGKNPGDNWQHGTFGVNTFMRACKITDTVACMDADTGKTLWKKDFPVDVSIFNGEGLKWSPHGGFDYIGVSSVPAVCNGKIYVVGAMGMYCLSTRDGALLWKAPGDPEHASPLVASGVVYNCGVAYDAEGGKVLWKNPNYKPNKKEWYKSEARYISAQLWPSGGTNYIITTDAERLCALDMRTGSAIWTVENSKFPFSHDSPFIVGGDILLNPSPLQAVRLTPSGVEPLWRRQDGNGMLAHQGYVYGNAAPKDRFAPRGGAST